LMEFGKKHLNDVFTLDGVQRVSARDKILREIISNLLMHRDFSSGYVPKLVIERDKITTENANLAHGHGNLNLKTFRPFAKNPPIAKVFREIGLADELGSGMRNSYKYTKMYSGGEPVFTEEDVFTTVIPLSEAATATVGPTTQGTTQAATQGTPQGVMQAELSERDKTLVNLLLKHPDYTQAKIANALNWDVNTVKYYMNKLKKNSVILRHGTSQNGYWEVIYKN
jgi:divergent AAA domain protein